MLGLMFSVGWQLGYQGCHRKIVGAPTTFSEPQSSHLLMKNELINLGTRSASGPRHGGSHLQDQLSGGEDKRLTEFKFSLGYVQRSLPTQGTGDSTLNKLNNKRSAHGENDFRYVIG